MVLRNTTTNQTFTIAGNVDPVTNIVTITATVPLPDGNYTFTSTVTGIVALSSGAPMANPISLNFFVLSGDADHNRSVDFNDLLILAKNYSKTGMTFSKGDFNYDGNVDFNDLLL